MTKQSPTYTIIVVGAGIFGVTAALALQQRGHTVSLFDPGPLPHPKAASTDISKVIRMDYGDDDFYFNLMEAAFAGWDLWNQEWSPPLYHQDGFLLLSRAEMQPGGFEYESFIRLKQRGYSLNRLDGDFLATHTPAWVVDQYPDGYYNPHGGWANSGAVVSQLLRRLQSTSAILHEGKRFVQLLESGSKVGGIITQDNEQHQADFVVMAAGVWTPVLLPYLEAVMWPVGQPVLHFEAPSISDFQPPHFFPWAADIARTGWYGFPAKADGTLKVANHGPGLRIHPDQPRLVDPIEVERFREFFRGSLPALANSPLLASRLCLYCDTWDGNFWIDHDPDREGLVVATGGSGHGFKFAPVLGGLIADVLERKPNPFAARFAWRKRGQLANEAARFAGH